jgi:hypothetical protein
MRMRTYVFPQGRTRNRGLAAITMIDWRSRESYFLLRLMRKPFSFGAQSDQDDYYTLRATESYIHVVHTQTPRAFHTRGNGPRLQPPLDQYIEISLHRWVRGSTESKCSSENC